MIKNLICRQVYIKSKHSGLHSVKTKTKVLNTTIDVLELAKVDDHLILLLKTFASLLLT